MTIKTVVAIDGKQQEFEFFEPENGVPTPRVCTLEHFTNPDWADYPNWANKTETERAVLALAIEILHKDFGGFCFFAVTHPETPMGF